MTWHFFLQKLVTLSKLSSVTHSYEELLLCFFFPLWGLSVIHFSLEVLLGLISSLICSALLINSQPAGFRKVPVFIFHLSWLLFTSQMLTDVVMRALLFSFCKECWFFFSVVFMDILIPGLLVCTAELTQGMQDNTSMEFQDLLRKFPAPWRRPWRSRLLVKLPQVKTCWEESRSRWLLCKCGETLSERL